MPYFYKNELFHLKAFHIKNFPIAKRPTNIKAVKTKILTVICIPPESIDPLVYLPTILAPIMNINPPTKVQITLLIDEFYLNFSQLL